VDDRPYPGRLRLLPRTDGRQLFDVINHVHLEAYLPGVLDRELYDDWSLATYHAQAIAARSYAIHRILEYGRQRAFDVEATQTSQVYGGSAVNPRSNRAVLETTGLVLAENDRVIPAFYSSACGGRGASPGDTWGQSLDYQALQPAPHQPWCRHASHFRWGPIRRRLDDLRARIAGWGRSKNKPLADLKQIATIVISRRNPVGRPAEFTLTDVTGRRYRLVADSFRMACNYSGDRKLPSDQRLRSADVEIQMHARHVELTGRGFGHGVGLCQWGAQAMAQAGHHAERILKTYYPGATIQRAY
jgi:stage II sporulation protein D